jgi:chromosome segregation ATPase
VNTAQELEQQLQAAREEAELTLEQLHLVQEELEVYFLKAQDLEDQLKNANAASKKAQAERDKLNKQLKSELKTANDAATKAQSECDEAVREREKLNANLNQLQDQLKNANAASKKAQAERDKLNKQLKSELKTANDAATKAQSERDEAVQQATDNASLLQTAQRMLDGQARYLEDLSLKEERAEQAVEELRLLKAEMLYYIQHSKPTRALDPERVQRLIELAKTPVNQPASIR